MPRPRRAFLVSTKLPMRLWPASSVPARRLANGPISESSPIDAIFGAHAQLQMASRANRHVAEPCGAVDSHALAELARAENLNVGTDNAVGRDFGLFRNVGRRGIDERHARRHQLAVNGRTNFRFHICQLLARVDAGELRRVVSNPRFDFFATRRARSQRYRSGSTHPGRCPVSVPQARTEAARYRRDKSRC